MLISCRFGTDPCNLNDFEWFFHSHFGNCCKINSYNQNKTLFQVTSSGRKNGLSIELYLGNESNS